MPRTIDHAKDANISDDDGYLHFFFKEPRKGAREVEMTDLVGPNGIFLFDGLQHQFDFRPPEGVWPYDNAVVDPIFDWLDREATGPWHWLEHVVNHGRSVSVEVYVKDDADVAAFRERWGTHFRFDEKQHIDNREIEEAQALAEAENVLPSEVTAAKVQYLIPAFNESTARYFDKMSSRTGFDDMVAEALSMHDSDWAREKGSKHGPRAEDGTLRPEALGGAEAFAAWMRDSGSPALVERIAATQFENPEYAAIFLRPAQATPPTI